jgi:hypothetical protein
MLVRVVHKTVRRSGRVSLREELLDVDQLSIGRGAGNDIQLNGLSIELRHSRLERRGDGVYLVPAEAPALEVNGRRTSERRLRPKDAIRIGSFELVVLPAGQGEDLGLELSQTGPRASEREELEGRTRVGLSRGLFTERKLSWLSVFLIPALFVGVPIATGTFETSWDSGPIARVHAFIANDCEKCHAVPFERVRDRECLQCHGDIRGHTPPGMQVVKLDQTRCAQCHLEHRGERDLARLEQNLCSECHQSLGEHAPKTKVRSVSDFGSDHPDFKLMVPTDSLVLNLAPNRVLRGDSSDWTRVVERFEVSPTLRESSGVFFNHARHVAQEERADGSGQLLSCQDCHKTDAAGKNMLGMNFEQHCQSCHSLGFDPRYPREAVHGDPVVMREDLLIFYEAKELEAIEERVRRGEILRARVGSEEEREQRAAARRNAQIQVQRADAFLMDQDKPGACANCHTVKPGEASDKGYDVAPVRLLNLWMPKSVFRHETHDPFPCRDCHPAAAVYDERIAAELEAEKPAQGRAGVRRKNTAPRARPPWSLPGVGQTYALFTREELARQDGLEPSEKAVDILLPAIKKCQGCHGGQHAPKPKVASECVLCHPFHREEFDRMRVIDAPEPITTSQNVNLTGAH